MSERAILVAQLARRASGDAPLGELAELARSAGVRVCAQLVVRRDKPVAATYLGAGVARQLHDLVVAHDAHVAIFDHAISPIQERNLEGIAQCRVLDRTGLILDIFAQRAQSSEGKLQVELAQLRHLSTRLVRGWSHLERQKGGVGLRGPGETQLETDRRLIGARIKSLRRALTRIESQRTLRRRARQRAPIPTVSLVGYTNAGKSSLFNRLTCAGARTANQLFATLDTTMRRVHVAQYGAVVLSDTVGFIRDLPHDLIAAFHSTLEELTCASCLLLVNDCADANRAELRDAVEGVLEEIGAATVPRIIVNNKIDLCDETPRIRRNAAGQIDAVWLSAHSGDGVQLLDAALGELLGASRRRYRLRIKPEAGALRAWLYRRAEVLGEQIADSGEIQLDVAMESAARGALESKRQFAGLWSEARE